MAADGDLKEHALNSSHDFYDLLGVPSTANESVIRRAYRKTALKYHPDKVGASDTAALEKFHLLQIAYDVLLEADVRQLYDNARRAREEKKEREQAYEGRRRQMKDDLERRENAGVAGLKRKREEASEEEAFQRELKRLAADGARRRREREEQLRKEAQGEFERENAERNGASTTPGLATPLKSRQSGAEEIDRTITLRYTANTKGATSVQLGKEELILQFSRFGKIEDAVLRNKKLKAEGEKHRREYTKAIIVFESIVGAHAAVTDIPTLASGSEGGKWSVFENVTWASGREPDCIPKPRSNGTPKTTSSAPREIFTGTAPSTPVLGKVKDADVGGGLRKVPSFGSFKGTPKASVQNSGTPGGVGSPSMEELTMIRLKNAERRRLAEKLRREEAEAEAEEAKERNTK